MFAVRKTLSISNVPLMRNMGFMSKIRDSLGLSNNILDNNPNKPVKYEEIPERGFIRTNFQDRIYALNQFQSEVVGLKKINLEFVTSSHEKSFQVVNSRGIATKKAVTKSVIKGILDDKGNNSDDIESVFCTPYLIHYMDQFFGRNIHVDAKGRKNILFRSENESHLVPCHFFSNYNLSEDMVERSLGYVFKAFYASQLFKDISGQCIPNVFLVPYEKGENIEYGIAYEDVRGTDCLTSKVVMDKVYPENSIIKYEALEPHTYYVDKDEFLNNHRAAKELPLLVRWLLSKMKKRNITVIDASVTITADESMRFDNRVLQMQDDCLTEKTKFILVSAYSNNFNFSIYPFDPLNENHKYKFSTDYEMDNAYYLCNKDDNNNKYGHGIAMIDFKESFLNVDKGNYLYNLVDKGLFDPIVRRKNVMTIEKKGELAEALISGIRDILSVDIVDDIDKLKDILTQCSYKVSDSDLDSLEQSMDEIKDITSKNRQGLIRFISCLCSDDIASNLYHEYRSNVTDVISEANGRKERNYIYADFKNIADFVIEFGIQDAMRDICRHEGIDYVANIKTLEKERDYSFANGNSSPFKSGVQKRSFSTTTQTYQDKSSLSLYDKVYTIPSNGHHFNLKFDKAAINVVHLEESAELCKPKPSIWGQLKDLWRTKELLGNHFDLYKVFRTAFKNKDEVNVTAFFAYNSLFEDEILSSVGAVCSNSKYILFHNDSGRVSVPYHFFIDTKENARDRSCNIYGNYITNLTSRMKNWYAGHFLQHICGDQVPNLLLIPYKNYYNNDVVFGVASEDLRGENWREAEYESKALADCRYLAEKTRFIMASAIVKHNDYHLYPKLGRIGVLHNAMCIKDESGKYNIKYFDFGGLEFRRHSFEGTYLHSIYHRNIFYPILKGNISDDQKQELADSIVQSALDILTLDITDDMAALSDVSRYCFAIVKDERHRKDESALKSQELQYVNDDIKNFINLKQLLLKEFVITLCQPDLEEALYKDFTTHIHPYHRHDASNDKMDLVNLYDKDYIKGNCKTIANFLRDYGVGDKLKDACANLGIELTKDDMELGEKMTNVRVIEWGLSNHNNSNVMAK